LVSIDEHSLGQQKKRRNIDEKKVFDLIRNIFVTLPLSKSRYRVEKKFGGRAGGQYLGRKNHRWRGKGTGFLFQKLGRLDFYICSQFQTFRRKSSGGNSFYSKC